LIPEKKIKARYGILIGILFWLITTTLYAHLHVTQTVRILGLAFELIWVGAFTWGCMNFAEGKGFSKWLGLLGLLSIFGCFSIFLIFWLFFCFPDRRKEVK
jgi:hypothetical protein